MTQIQYYWRVVQNFQPTFNQKHAQLTTTTGRHHLERENVSTNFRTWSPVDQRIQKHGAAWVLNTCDLRLPLWLKERKQNWQTYGLSPVCTRTCWFTQKDLLDRYPQTPQKNMRMPDGVDPVQTPTTFWRHRETVYPAYTGRYYQFMGKKMETKTKAAYQALISHYCFSNTWDVQLEPGENGEAVQS